MRRQEDVDLRVRQLEAALREARDAAAHERRRAQLAEDASKLAWRCAIRGKPPVVTAPLARAPTAAHDVADAHHEVSRDEAGRRECEAAKLQRDVALKLLANPPRSTSKEPEAS
jgi:hypothetical protein